MLTTQFRSAFNFPDLESPLVESLFSDPLTGVRYAMPSYPPACALTPRTFSKRDAFSYDAEPYTALEMVPVTHSCAGGCGRLVNVSNSAYIYDRGVCVAPNTCACVHRQGGLGAAFYGSSCETTQCDVTCRNGDCVYNATLQDTACVCSSVSGSLSL